MKRSGKMFRITFRIIDHKGEDVTDNGTKWYIDIEGNVCCLTGDETCPITLAESVFGEKFTYEVTLI